MEKTIKAVFRDLRPNSTISSEIIVCILYTDNTGIIIFDDGYIEDTGLKNPWFVDATWLTRLDVKNR